MLFAAVNFSTHFVALRKRDLSAYRRDAEARWVFVWLGAAIMIASALVYGAGLYQDVLQALRHTAPEEAEPGSSEFLRANSSKSAPLWAFS
jgi:trk system potassium uptake protein TrkH